MTVNLCSCRRALVSVPLSRRVVCRAEQADASSDSRPQLEIPIAEVDAHMKPKQGVASQQAASPGQNLSASSHTAEDSQEERMLRWKASALELDAGLFRSSLQELLLLLPGVTQAKLFALEDEALKDLICDTAAVATRLVQLSAKWTACATGAPPGDQQQQPCQALQVDSLRFIRMHPELLVGTGWDSFLARTPVASLYGHTRDVMAVAVTPDGRHAVSGSLDTTLRVWDLQARTCIGRLLGHSKAVLAVAVSPDGRYAVSGSSDTTLRVWDLRSYTCLATLKGHKDRVHAVAFTPDGRRVVSGSEDRTLKVWDRDLSSYTCSTTLAGHHRGVVAVAATPDGCRAVSGSNDKTMRLWDLQKPDFIAMAWEDERQEDPAYVSAVTTTPDGRYAVSGSLDGNLRVWDLQTASASDPYSYDDHLVAFIPGSRSASSTPLPPITAAVVFTPDGRHVVTGGGPFSLYVWDLQAGPLWSACVTQLQGHAGLVNSVAVTTDGCYAVSASNDCSVGVWDLRPHTQRAGPA